MVRDITPADQVIWDDYVEAHPQASPYHLIAWKCAVESSYGHSCHYYIAESEGEVRGILPLVSLNIPLLGRELCSLPFCDLGGVLASDELAKNTLHDFVLERTKERACRKLSLRQTSEVDTPVDELPQGAKVRMVLDLPPSSQELLKGFKSKLRSQIRKAEKNGVSFRIGNDADDRAAFYNIMQINMHKLGSPVHSRCWFDSVLDQFGSNAVLALVEFNEIVVGGAILLFCGKVATVPWASTLPEYNRLSPNMMLYWGMLELASDRGAQYFDFGRSSMGEGTYNFKKQWGAQPVLLNWREYKDGHELAGVQDALPSGRRELVANVWASLPLAMVNWFGPFLRRYISL